MPIANPQSAATSAQRCAGLLILLVALLSLPVASPASAEEFNRGDANGDGTFDGLVDGLAIFGWFLGSSLNCLDAADANDDGSVNVVDVVYVLYFQFEPGGFPPPAPPFGFCGVDPTADALDCVEYVPCQAP